MCLLLSQPTPLSGEQREDLSKAVAAARQGRPTGVLVPEEKLEQWTSALSR